MVLPLEPVTLIMIELVNLKANSISETIGIFFDLIFKINSDSSEIPGLFIISFAL